MASDSRTHVIVVGGGLAGLSAALSAADAGARVTVFEKEKGVGGNSAKATSGMNAHSTPAQAEAGIADSEALFFADTIASGQGHSDPTLARVLATKAPDAVEFVRRYGVALDGVTICGGHSVPRTHHEKPRADGKPTPVGWDVITGLRKAAEARPDDITFRSNTRVVGLLQESVADGSLRGRGAVTGVKILPSSAAVTATAAAAGAAGMPSVADEVTADAVVLTTGGFANDHTSGSLLDEFAPQLACLPTTNGPFAQGDGVKMAREVGAHLRGMEAVQVHPTGLVDPADPGGKTKFLGPEALRGVGGLLLNHHGKRFVNELGRRDEVSAAMYRSCTVPGADMSQGEAGLAPGAKPLPAPVHAFIVLNAPAVATFGPNFNFYWKVKGMFTEVHGPAGLAAAIGSGATAEGIAEELKAYHAAAATGRDAFGKTTFPQSFEGAWEATAPLYVARVVPSIHYTMGGVSTNAAGELLYADGGDVSLARRVGVPVKECLDDVAAEAVATTLATSLTAVAAADGSVSARRDSLAHMHDLEVGPEDHAGALFEEPILRPIPRLFGAGEVTGGLHGQNRLAGNSLLECVVFGRLAGARAAAIARTSSPALTSDAFTALTFRESHRLCPSVYLFRFNLPSPLHASGLKVGQYIAVRATLDGKETLRYYSPMSRPDDLGHIDLLMKVDASGGAMTTHVNSLKPGDTLEFKGPLGGLDLDFSTPTSLGKIKKIGLICGGTGLAAMSQIMRSAFYHRREEVQIKLIYAAAAPSQLAYLPLLKRKAAEHKNFELYCAVDKVPEGETWDGHVGFVTADVVREHMWAPGDDIKVVICGPYPMCMSLKNKVLPALGYTPDMFFSYM